MKPERRAFGRTPVGRHEAWIDRRSPRIAASIRQAMRRGSWSSAGRAVNDNGEKPD